MSITTHPGMSHNGVPELTFKERLRARRKSLVDNVVFEMPIPGYEKDGLWGRYRVLGYEEIRGISVRVEGETDDPITVERLTAAVTLVESCEELLELTGNDDNGKPIFQSTGYRWSPAAASELFDVHLPDGVAQRDAIMQIFPYPRDILMMKHFEDYLGASMGYLPEIEEVLQGESQAASAPTTSVSSPQQR